MKFEIGNNVIASYKRLSYEPWYAFAEFVDNSTQAYFDHRDILDKEFDRTGLGLQIRITYNRDEDYIEIWDNSIGMDEATLDRAIKVGIPPINNTQRSKYGLGMKTAACWFGNTWSIETKKLGHNLGYKIEIDVDFISKQEVEVELTPETFTGDINTHYTRILIRNLNRRFVGRTIHKIREYLGSIYRFDIGDGIKIYWNNALLEWHSFDDELYVTAEGIKYKKHFSFLVNSKLVEGWVGVLGSGHGSRKKAGFSIAQNKRVIQGWPNAYKPMSIFGDQEDGRNDLVNQRIVGEISLDKFSVSHTKDKIIWEGEEEEELDKMLGEVCAEAKELALTLRFKQANVPNLLAKLKEEAVGVLESELKSYEIKNYLTAIQPAPEKIIQASFEKTSDRIEGENEPVIAANIGSGNDIIQVIVFFSENSEFEPYVLVETTIEENKVIIILNMLHPHVQEMTTGEAFTNFLRHAIYDGVAEWKSIKIRGNIQPFTIKFLKDGLLRIPFEIKQNKFV